MPGPMRAKLPKDACMFQMKIDHMAGRDLSEFARRVGLSRSTIFNWLYRNKAPNLTGLRLLAAATGTDVVYWTDDSIMPMPPAELGAAGAMRAAQQESPLVGRVAARTDNRSYEAEESKVTCGYDAIDPRALEVRGDSAFPFAADGQCVVFDLGRRDEVENGRPVVVETEDGELMLKRRYDLGNLRVYTSINPSHEPVVLHPRRVRAEYPVVAVLVRPKKGESHDE